MVVSLGSIGVQFEARKTESRPWRTFLVVCRDAYIATCVEIGHSTYATRIWNPVDRALKSHSGSQYKASLVPVVADLQNRVASPGLRVRLTVAAALRCEPDRSFSETRALVRVDRECVGNGE